MSKRVSVGPQPEWICGLSSAQKVWRNPRWCDTGTRAREPLRAGRLVLDLLGLAQGIHRFLDGQEDCRFERAKRTAATNRQRNRGHGLVVGGLPEGVAVVCAEGLPEPVELPSDRLDVRLSGLSAV